MAAARRAFRVVDDARGRPPTDTPESPPSVTATASSRPREPADGTDHELIRTWQQVRKTMTAVDTRLACALSDAEAPASLVHEALAAIAASPDRMVSMSALAGTLGVSTGGCTKLVDRMIAAGFARRRHSSTDRRIIYAELTESGAGHERTSTGEYAQQLRIELSVLGPDRLAQLRHICEVLQRWDPTPVDVGAPPSEVSTRRDVMGLPPLPGRGRHVGRPHSL